MGTRFSILELLLIIAIFGLSALLAKSAWDNWNGPVEVLKTDDWQCLEHEEREYTYPMLVGKVMVMQTGRRDECVHWKRPDR